MEWIIYCLRVSIGLALFFAFYLTFLRRLTFFKWNRIFLLSAAVLSFLFPLFQITWEREAPVEPVLNKAFVNSDRSPQWDVPASLVDLPAEVGAADIPSVFDWSSLMIYGYFAVCLVIGAIGFWRLFHLMRFIKPDVPEIGGLKVISKTNGFTNCSFFNYVFVNHATLSKVDFEVLVEHERVHAEQLHSIDKLLFLFIKSILWFNPIVYWYEKALEEVHEFEADEKASISAGVSNYAYSLLNMGVAKQSFPLPH